MPDDRPTRTVIMAAIPGRVVRGSRVRDNLSYVPYARAAWEWWCRQNDVGFLLLETPFPDEPLVGAPPPIHRWQAATRHLRGAPRGSQVAVVDADTMIRWDTPDFFALAGDSLAAVPDRDPLWISESIDAYQSFFPGVQLRWWEYVNTGLVVFSTSQAHIPAAVVDFYHRHRAELEVVQRRSDAGVDQTLLNFLARVNDEPVLLLPKPFNLVGCVPVRSFVLASLESAGDSPQTREALARIMRMPRIFKFIEYAYIWHFTSTVGTRTEFMRQTWQRVRARYPGACEPEAQGLTV